MNLNAHYLAQSPAQEIRRGDSRPAVTKIVPFDYVITVKISGKPNNIVRNVVDVSVEGYFVATAISYSLLAEPEDFGPVRPEGPVVQQLPAFNPPRPPRAILRVEPGQTASKMKIHFTIFGTPGALIALKVKGLNNLPLPQKLQIGKDGKLEYTTDDFTAPNSLKSGTVFIQDVTNHLISQAIQFRVKKGSELDFRPQFGSRQPFAGENEIEILGHGNVEVSVFGKDSDLSNPKFTKTYSFTHESQVLTLKVIFEPGDQILIESSTTGQNSLITVPEVFDYNLANIPIKYLGQGFRIKPHILRQIQLGLPVSSIFDFDTPFEACGAEHLSFLYSITDYGSGRELQSEPIHNIAGLGIENGDRPFRVFPKPIVFEPRSVIQFEVQEKDGGAGMLYFVLQGYKVLGTGGVRMEE
jgi:hypothetical protein